MLSVLRRLLAALLLAPLLCSAARAAAPDTPAIRLEISVLKGLEAYSELLTTPGFLAICLENNGFSLSSSSRMKIGERGRSVEVRGMVLRFSGRTGPVYSYDAAISLGVGAARLEFPVTIDTADSAAGKVVVTLSPALAGLIPEEIIDHIRLKIQMAANPALQQALLGYLRGLESAGGGSGGPPVDAILLDAYRRSGGPNATRGADVGDAVPLSEQWMLILTLAIWGFMLPAAYLVLRRLSAKPRPGRKSGARGGDKHG